MCVWQQDGEEGRKGCVGARTKQARRRKIKKNLRIGEKNEDLFVMLKREGGELWSLVDENGITGRDVIIESTEKSNSKEGNRCFTASNKWCKKGNSWCKSVTGDSKRGNVVVVVVQEE